MNASLLHTITTALLSGLLGLGALIALLLAWPSRAPRSTLASLAEAGARADYRDLPPLQSYRARDGAALAYRCYAAAGAPSRIAVLVHGSSGDSHNMHAIGRHLQAEGLQAYALDMRGHGASGRRGDVDYIGQLDDDLADFVALLRQQHPKATLSLVGLSSGGGFTLRSAGGANGELFDRYVMLAPMLHQAAPTARPQSGGWVRANVPRMIALTLLDKLGLRLFQQLPVLAFALPPEAAATRTLAYSYRLQLSFRPHEDYLADVRGIRRPCLLLVGAKDEIFRAEQYAPLLEPLQPLLKVEVLPGLKHLDVAVDTRALQRIAAAV
ncbi:alpha/beta fold hydrolase [Paucibacter sp. APW11]|uniref:Alpha/beta fold hydrolase n=1 Tax=Roseateles aquae TaxID=3077235 RepID=A0ABU3PJ17_9BURK|nr:alpha/beta fold hydrolase [Paucibacter sp. APW11]MDT9002041.1 alpha/beta fold hydrolase [Paucibacter sp. APW11]